MRRLYLIVVLLGCSSTTLAPLDQPVFLNVRWAPASTAGSRSSPAEEHQRQAAQELIALTIRNGFRTRFSTVTDTQSEAALRVSIEIHEDVRPVYTGRLKIPHGQVAAAPSGRCGTVTYALYADQNRLVSRAHIPLPCDAAGRTDYRRAGLTVADAAAHLFAPTATVTPRPRTVE